MRAQGGAHGADPVAGGQNQRRARIEADRQRAAADDQRVGIKPADKPASPSLQVRASTFSAHSLSTPLPASTCSLHAQVQRVQGARGEAHAQ